MSSGDCKDAKKFQTSEEKSDPDFSKTGERVPRGLKRKKVVWDISQFLKRW